ncbi:succinate dehydrogenase, hydrophobic membrane anchor protein [Paracoccus sp. R12_1]|jgi:succinate dehydrogenase / fumarate reductase, membrane anchor subunit|uniref:succinate dehydrogenase, hydrophobic membrane anchor protein n=1 Tax=unclassified Paracoccus (in: a-proteobacteria) TaxID=2688777 RepID=UPI000C097119|nr:MULTISPECIES: succinate dehydrogenase, hydrophobic membrane anchor protein [unclassified Paracoccus (in: a-proteobacteria)]MBO9454249.1 succinate dehydrogenase, hydrophobic membrane anchor protein [Paracoccus sp. R12_2]MBO9485035.1 succinate dehydrogenase, hydrophobic membrane anchor protein [Paracoccus sp. R12_1]PHQ67120.1 MAG: succinate dehydrogenase [Paracoccus sp. (in: a-proteobacteria)]
MRYITPRKAAAGLGSAHSGTGHHWAMTVSACALILLTPAFLLVVGSAIGLPREALIGYFGRPYPGIVTALFVIVGMIHFIKGTRIMIDDYFQGTARKGAIIVSVIFSWAVIAAAVFALAKMAFITIAI